MPYAIIINSTYFGSTMSSTSNQMVKLRHEMSELIQEISKQLQVGICEKLCNSTDKIKMKESRLEINKPQDIELAFIVSFFTELTEPIVVVKLKIDESRLEDEFEIIEDEKNRKELIELDALPNIRLFNTQIDDDYLRNPSYYKLNLKMWKDFNKSVFSLREQDLKGHQYRVKSNPKFLLTIYQIIEFHDIIFSHSTALINEDKPNTEDPKEALKQALRGENTESCNLSNISQFVEDNFKLVSQIRARGDELTKKANQKNFAKKDRQTDASSQKGDPELVQVGDELIKKVREIHFGVSVIKIEVLHNNEGENKSNNSLNPTIYESKEIGNSQMYESTLVENSYTPEDQDEIDRLEAQYDNGGFDDAYNEITIEELIKDFNQVTKAERSPQFTYVDLQAVSKVRINETIDSYI
jgi:hypothetical protein